MKFGDRAILLINNLEINKLGFYKGHMFNVESVDGLIDGIYKLCDVGFNYVTTYHKFQGRTINEDFNIFEIEK